ncbi:MAG: aldo/keto reductase [Gammaproteobacteria bacterium]|nr:aldo/keto reductase [Gammaproteobacteria bacterium]
MSAIPPLHAMPMVGFGTYLISNDEVAHSVESAISVGYRHIDTAAGYGNEQGVGEGIRAAMQNLGLSRSDLFITTKLWPGNAAWGDAPKNFEQTVEACEHSLKLLGLAYIDLYLIHAPSGAEQRINQWKALQHLKQAGKVKHIGVSNFTEAHLDELKNAGEAMPEFNQIELHPWSQKPALLSYMAAHHIHPIAYSSLVPLSSWRVAPGQASAKTEQMKADGTDSPFQRMAEKYKVSEAQLLLRWGVQKGYAVLPKSTNLERMRQNIDLFGFEIDAEDMALIAQMDRGDGVAWATGDPRFMG